MYLNYGDQVEFFIVYIREAHPSDGRKSQANEREGISILQPKTYEERVAVADKLCATLNLLMPAVIDDMKNTANNAYNAAPDRLYLIGKDGRVAYKGDHGPKGFKPGRVGRRHSRGHRRREFRGSAVDLAGCCTCVTSFRYGQWRC